MPRFGGGKGRINVLEAQLTSRKAMFEILLTVAFIGKAIVLHSLLLRCQNDWDVWCQALRYAGVEYSPLQEGILICYRELWRNIGAIRTIDLRIHRWSASFFTLASTAAGTMSLKLAAGQIFPLPSHLTILKVYMIFASICISIGTSLMLCATVALQPTGSDTSVQGSLKGQRSAGIFTAVMVLTLVLGSLALPSPAKENAGISPSRYGEVPKWSNHYVPDTSPYLYPTYQPNPSGEGDYGGEERAPQPPRNKHAATPVNLYLTYHLGAGVDGAENCTPPPPRNMHLVPPINQRTSHLNPSGVGDDGGEKCAPQPPPAAKLTFQGKIADVGRPVA